MRSALMLFVVATLAAPIPAGAQTPSAFGGLRIAPKESKRSPQAAGRRDPYSRLFGEPLPPSRRVPSAGAPVAASTTPVVKCGMTMIPGDSNVDPGIATRTPPSSGQAHSRVVEPTLCR